MNFARGALGGAIALCVAALIVFAIASAHPVRPAGATDEPPPDGGRSAFGGPGQAPASNQGARSLRTLAQEERMVPQSMNVYRNTLGTSPQRRLAGVTPRVYVPNSKATTVDVIDPVSMAVTGQIHVGSIPHHVTPSWDMSKLYVDNEGSSSLTVIDPIAGAATGTIPVPFPYNLYFTPDGSKAVVIVERLARIDFRDPTSWQLIKSVPIPWRGIDHVDFSADGGFLLGSTEWSGILVKVDTTTMEITGSLNVGGLPIDVRLAPDGSVFYVTNQGRHGVSIIDANLMKEVGFLPTGRGAHGLQVSRDTRFMYVTNRDAGSISVIDLSRRDVAATWQVGGSPDMIQLSPDGTRMWTSGRYQGTVMVVDTDTGALIKTINAGPGAHGLTYFPNVGLYSTGHNGVYR